MQAEPQDVVFVSQVIGEGTEAYRNVKVGDLDLVAPGVDGTEVLIPALEAAERLRFTRPRDINKLIERIWPENQRPCVRATVAQTQMPTGGIRKDEVKEYLLTESQLLKVCARARTKVAEAILDDMIRVYIVARRFLTGALQGLGELRSAITELAKGQAVLTAYVGEQFQSLARQQEETSRRVDALNQRMIDESAEWRRYTERMVSLARGSTARSPDDVLLGEEGVKDLRNRVKQIVDVSTSRLRPSQSRPAKIPIEDKAAWAAYDSARKSVRGRLYMSLRSFAGQGERGQRLTSYPVGEPYVQACMYLAKEIERARSEDHAARRSGHVATSRQQELFPQTPTSSPDKTN